MKIVDGKIQIGINNEFFAKISAKTKKDFSIIETIICGHQNSFEKQSLHTRHENYFEVPTYII